MRCDHRILALAPLLFCLAGCVESLTEVVVHKDGSGIVYYGSYMNANANPLGAALGQFGVENTEPKTVTIDEESFEKAASRLGKGVRLEWVKKKQNSKGWDGVLAKYAFDDVTQLQLEGGGLGISTFDGVIRPQQPEADMTGLSEKKVTFGFSPGDTSELTVDLPPMTPPQDSGLPGAPASFPDSPDNVLPGGGEPTEAQVAQMMAMMRPMLEGARFLIRVRVNGEIVDTNASHVSKNGKVALLDIKLVELIEDEENRKVLQGLQGVEDEDTIRTDLAKVKGVRMELKPEIHVKFK